MFQQLSLEEKAKFEKYFSIEEENELVLKTLNILKVNKLRKMEPPLKDKEKTQDKTPKNKPPIHGNKTEDLFHLNSLNKIK